MRLQTLSSQDAHEVSKFNNHLLMVREGTEPEDDNQMIHIDNKFVVPWITNSDYVGQIIFMCPKMIYLT